MNLEALQELISDKSPMPCDDCPDRQRCTDYQLACASFTSYVHSGRPVIRVPLILIRPPSNKKDSKPYLKNGFVPNRKMYRSMFPGSK